MEVAYFNEKLAVWEPLVEPVEGEKGAYRAWEIILDVKKYILFADYYKLHCRHHFVLISIQCTYNLYYCLVINVLG